MQNKIKILSWSLYDLANQFFALNIVSLYFPRWLTIEKGTPDIYYSLSFGISMLLVAVFAPILGTISDIKKRPAVFLFYFTIISILFTMAIGFVSNVFLALVFFAIANFGCQEAVVFYNALMVNVTPKNKIGLVSGLGRMFGYSGAILALYLTKPIILNMGYQATFFFTGLLFLIFSLPCLILIKDAPSEEKLNLINFFKKGNRLSIFNRLKSAVSDSHKFTGLRNFLIASFFGLCAVNTIIIFISVYVTRVFGLSETQIINLIAFSTLFAIGGSILSGFMSDIVGYRYSLIGVFFLWGICFLAGSLFSKPFYWLIGALAGISLGSTWVISRALVIKLVPQQMVGEAFGLFNLVGYVSALIGPLFWGLIILFFDSLGEFKYRIALFSLNIFIVIGIVFLLKMSKELRQVENG